MKNPAKKNEELLPIGAKKRSSKKQEETVVQSKSTGEAVKKMGKGIVGVLVGARNAMERYSNWVQEQNRKTEEKRLKMLQDQKAQAERKPETGPSVGVKGIGLFQGTVQYGGLGQAARPGKSNIPEAPPTSIWSLAGNAMKKAGKKEEKD